MTEISTRFGSGGANLTPGASGEPSLATTLREIADDLAALNGATVTIAAPVTSGALPAFTDPPTAGEMAALRTLVNELRACVLELTGVAEGTAGVTLKTVAV